MTEPELHALLTRVGDDVDVEGALDRRVAAFARFDRRSRRRRHTATSVLVSAALIVAGSVVLAERSRPSGTSSAIHVVTGRTRPTSTAPLLTGPSGPTAPSGPTVAQLAARRWRELPPAPISLAGDASVVWTGSKLFVWGGSEGVRSAPTRAALYDPSSRSWTLTAPAPIAARSGALTAWTGREVLIWGGRIGPGYASIRGDGAAFDPARGTWRKMSVRNAPSADPSPPSIVPALRTDFLETGVWTGRELLVFAGPQPISSTTTAIDAVAYDPTSDQWRTVSRHALPFAPGRLEGIDAVAGHGGIYVWLSWDYAFTTTTGRGGISSTQGKGAGQDSFALTRDGHWRLARSTGVVGSIEAPIVAGDHIVALGGRELCRACSVPWTKASTVVLSDPGPGADSNGVGWFAVPDGPLFSHSEPQVWSGRLVLRYDEYSGVTGPGHNELPGDLAALDLKTLAWTSLPRSPRSWEVGQIVWVGDRLVLWGDLYPTACPGDMPSCAPGTKSSVGGSELVPSAHP